jgi:DNA ligase-1
MKDFETLSRLIDELNSTNSINEKKLILSRFSNNEFIKKVLYYTYNPFYQYYVTPDTLEKHYEDDLGTLYIFNDLFEMLDVLRSREISGHRAINSVNDFCYSNEDYKELIYRIIGKDLQIRMGVSLINKVIPNLIPTFDVALATDFEDVEVDFKSAKWIASRKLDGVRCLTIVDDLGNVSCWSRQGNQFETLDKVASAIKQLGLTSCVFDGEICLIDKNGNEDFQGIMRQIRRKNHTIQNPKYLIFDYLTLQDFQSKKSSVVYSDRLDCLKHKIVEQHFLLSVVSQEEIQDEVHLNSLMSSADANGWEGLILRKNVGYEGKRSKNMLKCKSFKDAEYQVIGVEFGPFRMIENGLEITKDVLSNVIIEHKNNRVSVGSGFTIEQREYYKERPEEILNKTITVKYFQETQNQNGNWSLRFPTVKHIYTQGRTV